MNLLKPQKIINKFLNFSSFFLFLYFFISLFSPISVHASNNDIDIPVILSRSTWMSPDLQQLSNWTPSQDSFPPDYRKAERIIIHHSAGSNDIANPIATIQGIYRYHAVTKGWLDIGYNYVIDREGKIYEGRLGGNGIRGAHVYDSSDCLNFNYGSIGIVLLGNYANEQPPEAMYASLAKLTGWIAASNNLDPTKTAYYSLVWQDKKTPSGTCDSSAGAFSYNYYGPVVSGHKEVGNTQCPGVTDINRVRREAGEYAKKFQISNFKFQIIGKNELYEIKDGYAKLINPESRIPNPEEKILAISQTQLDLFSEKRFYKYPDGSLLKFGGEEIYLVESGGLRQFESKESAQKLGFDFSKLIATSDSSKNLYGAGAPIKYGPDGKLLAASGTAFFIDKGKKRPFTSAPLFESLGYKWKNLGKTDQATLDSYLTGDYMRYKDGTLLSVGNTIFVLENGLRRGITSATLFNTLKYNWKSVIPTTEQERAIYSEGEIKRYPNNTLAKSASSPATFLLQNGEREGFTTAEIFENLKYKWKDVLQISDSEIAAYPYDGEVKYPDGFVLRYNKDSTVYVIQEGKKRAFSSADEFLKEGHKWKDVVVLKTSDLDRYEIFGKNLAENQQDTKEIEKQRNEEMGGNNNNLAGLIGPIMGNNQKSFTQGGSASGEEIGNQKSEENKNEETKEIKEIRIALKSFNKNVGITSSGGNFNVKDAAGNIIYTAAAGNIYTINFGENTDAVIEIVDDGRGRKSSAPTILIYSIDDKIIDAANPFHSGYGGATDNIFKGKIKIKYSSVSRKCWIINELSLDDYVKGVAEVNDGQPAEYLKAMSVIIRTYAYYHLSNGGKHAGEPFDLKNSLDGNGDDQVYKGQGFASRVPVFSNLVDSTSGKVIAYNSKPILAAFSSDSGGVSKDARKVWPGGDFSDKPYLYGGVKDPDSTAHDAAAVSASHGVGLSAAGAREMAKLGKNWEEIVRWYYAGVSVDKIK